MTTPASAEPTDDDRAKAIVAMSQALNSDRLTVGHAITLVARLLASQRAEIVARYEAVAAELDEDANRTLTFLRDRGNGSINHTKRRTGAYAQQGAAARIREAAPK